MVWIGEREITMPRGWIAQFRDGTIVCEDDMPWKKVPNKRNIRRMILKWEDRTWSFDDKENYTVPSKRGYIDVNMGGVSQGIHSRTIGYYSIEEHCKVIMRVDEATGKMALETIPFK
jgi:hypothetical protein